MRKRNVLIFVVFIIVGVAFGEWWYLAYRLQSFTAFGTVEIHEVQDLTCEGDYDGIGTGSQLIITDQNNKIVGTGKLQSPAKSQGPLPLGETICTFRWSVSRVPAGGGLYQLTAGNLRSIILTEADLHREVHLS